MKYWLTVTADGYSTVDIPCASLDDAKVKFHSLRANGMIVHDTTGPRWHRVSFVRLQGVTAQEAVAFEASTGLVIYGDF